MYSDEKQRHRVTVPLFFSPNQEKEAGAGTAGRKREVMYEGAEGEGTAAGRVHPVFYVFWSGEPDIPALHRRSGGYRHLDCLCGSGGVSGGLSHSGRGGSGPFRRLEQAGGPGEHPVCGGVHLFDLPVHRPLPGHSQNGLHLLEMAVTPFPGESAPAGMPS